MQQASGVRGYSMDQADGAVRFAALVHCSIEEAQDWLRRSNGTMEAALDSYLTNRKVPKRQRICKESPSAQHSATPKAANLEADSPTAHLHGRQGCVGDVQRAAGRRSSPTRIASVHNGASAETPTSGVLMIEVADDSDDESVSAAGEVRASDRYALSGDGIASPVPEACCQSPVVEQPPLPLSQLPDDFSFSLGECVASGTVTSGTISRLSLTDPLALMVEVRMPLAQRAGSQQSFRKAKLSNSGYRIVYVRLDDPLLHEHQKWLGQPKLRGKCRCGSFLSDVVPSTTQFKRESATGSRGCSPLAGVNFQELLSSISEQTTFLRLLINGREAVRLDRQVASSLSTLLLLGAIKVDISWLPDKLPPRRLIINSSLSVRMAISVTLQALRLSALKQTGDPYVSQLQFPVLMGQAFSSLVDLMSLQLAGGDSSVQRHDGVSLGAGTSEDVKLRERLEVLKERSSAGAFGPVDFDEAGKEPEGVASTGAAGLQKIPERNCPTASLEDEDDEAKSTALCHLIFGEATAAKNPREQKSHRRLGSVYPPESVFVSRLRPYQAQGLWWMLQCESGESPFVGDECECLDPLWKMYRLPVPCTTTVSGTHGNDAVFVPSYLYVNASAGLVSISKPHLSGRVRGGILADCMGLGKTVQVLALIAVSALRERDPHNEASWIGAPAGGQMRREQTNPVAPEDAEPSDNAVEPSLSVETDISVLSPSASQVSVEPPSPIYVNSDVEPAAMHPALSVKPPHSSKANEPVREPKKSKRFAPNPHVLQRSLKRDEDNLLPGGTLIIVPLSLISQWQAEVKRHLRRGVATVIRYYGSSRCREAELLAAHTIVLTTYQTLASDFRALTKLTAPGVENTLGLPELAFTSTSDGVDTPLASIRFRRVVLDEGHTIKNTSSLLNRACNALKADARWILTGTPLQNDLSDAFALVQFLRVSPMGSRRWWRAKVTQVMERGMVRAAVETVRRVLAPLMLRRQGSDTDEDGKPLLPLPSIKIHTFRLQLTYEERLFYQTVFEQSKAKFDQLVKSGQVLQHYTHVLQLLLRLRQACNHPLLPSYREEQRSQKLVKAICTTHDPSSAASTKRGQSAPLSLSPAPAAADPFFSKLVEEAMEGALRECPICFEVPREAVVLTNCWHTLCMTCILLLQSTVRSTECSASKKERRSPDRSAQKEEVFNFSTNSAELLDSRSPMASYQRFLQPEPVQNTAEAEFFFSTKMRMLLALLERDVTSGRSCVIFSQWTSMLDLLETALKVAEESRHFSFGDIDCTIELDDKVDEIGSIGGADLPRKTGVSALDGHDEVLGQASCNSSNLTRKIQQTQPVHRLFHYRRIDGTLNLEARQRIIRWFTEPSAGTAGTVESASSSTSDDDHDGPFLGRCGLKPFSGIRNCQRTSLESGHHVPPRLQPCESVPRSKHLGKILLLSLKTGNVGLNLIKATRCYLIDGWWNPQVEMQAMRRIWRYGQDKPVSVYRFICVRTVEERMEELLEWKERLSRNTLRRADTLEQCGMGALGDGDEDGKKRGRLSLQDLKKLFEGWEADNDNL
ncbi:hypothetical protein Esti_000351 [Eimeria stiedai]